MNKCMHCGVRILDDTDVCPLCHCVLQEEDGQPAIESYPDIRLKARKLELAGRIALFLAIVLGTLAIIINYTHPTSVWWSAIVVGGLADMMLILFFIVENKRAGYRSKALLGVACIAAYMVLIDYVFGFTHWSLDYAVPAALLVIDIMIVIVMFVNMRNWQSYLLFQIFMILCSGVCVILSLTGVIRRPLMSYAAFGLSCAMFLAAFIIGGRRARNELKRRFHVM